MTHEEAIKAKFDEEAHEIYVKFSPMLEEGGEYILDKKVFDTQLQELGNQIMGIDAPDLAYDFRYKKAQEYKDKYTEKLKPYVKFVKF